MPIISRSSILNLKARVDIVEVVSAVVTLKRAGSKYKGLSPFNAEKTPSFFVSPDKGLFKCFSSGKAGDVITFVMETENLSFTEAAEALAQRYHVELEYEKGGRSREERSLRQELFDLHEIAAAFFHEAFCADDEHGAAIRAYWTGKRRFELAVAEDFKIGFAEPTGAGLLQRLRQRNFSETALRQSGLFYGQHGGGLMPRFRGRLMIPIRDHQGRVVAFTARQLDVTPADDPAREAKYINSPETPIFIKGHLLFNLDRARKHASDGQPFLMVEGQLDAIRCWTAGLTTAIAPQGTGITEIQMRLLRRFQPAVECLLDGDSAGQKAALRLVPLALEEGIEVGFLPLPGKTDPDDWFRDRGAAGLEELRSKRLTAMGFVANTLAPRPREMTAQQIAAACREIFVVLNHSTSEIAKAEYLAELGDRLGLNRSALEMDFKRFRDETVRHRHPAQSTPVENDSTNGISTTSQTRDQLGPPEEDLIKLVFVHEELGKQLATKVDHEWIDKSTLAGRLLDRFLNDFEHDLWPGTDQLDQHLEDQTELVYVSSLRFELPEIDNPIQVANDCIRRIVSNFCGPKIAKNQLEIAAKQRNVDADQFSLNKANFKLLQLRLNPPTL